MGGCLLKSTGQNEHPGKPLLDERRERIGFLGPPQLVHRFIDAPER
jgi:hypothetical protein